MSLLKPEKNFPKLKRPKSPTAPLGGLCSSFRPGEAFELSWGEQELLVVIEKVPFSSQLRARFVAHKWVSVKHLKRDQVQERVNERLRRSPA